MYERSKERHLIIEGPKKTGAKMERNIENDRNK